MISLEPRPVGMWVLPDKKLLLCWDNAVEELGLGFENQKIRLIHGTQLVLLLLPQSIMTGSHPLQPPVQCILWALSQAVV
jgi:hypothetical protein